MNGTEARTRNAIFDWGNAIVLALAIGLGVSVVFGAAVLLLAGGSAG